MLTQPTKTLPPDNGRGQLPPLLQSLYAPIEKPLAEVELVLQKELTNECDPIDDMLRHGRMLGGKRLRPALLLLSAAAAGKINSDHITLAAVLEMIHLATLIHDDVLDEAAMRRHLATTNSIWDNEASVLLGDYLFTHAFYLASTLETTFACRTIGKTTNTVCAGELQQVRSRGNFQLTEQQYLQIIDAKTASLCSCSCHLGAHYAGADESAAQRLSAYGRHLGIAFQIADDLLDLIGDDAVTGKSLGTDLDKQKPTLPLIHLLRESNESDRGKILSLLDTAAAVGREDLIPWLTRYDSIRYARQIGHGHAREARRQIEPLPDSPARQTLLQMADFVMARSQ